MGERIDFPKNYELYLRKAVHKFQEGNMVEACTYFEEAYAIKQESSINAMYVSALFQLERYKEAQEIAEDKLELYESDDSLYSLYTTILIKNHSFKEAELIIQRKLSQLNQTANKEVWHTAKYVLEHEQNRHKQNEKKRNQELLKEILAMGDQSFEHQAALIKQMQEMSNEWYTLGARSVLRNPFVNEIVKTTVLEHLVREGVTEEFEMYWFDQRRFVVPADQSSLEENKRFKEVVHLLKEKFEDDNPTMYQALLQEVNLHFLMLYPYIEEVVTDASKWLGTCFNQYDAYFLNLVENDPDNQIMKTWIQRLNEEIAAMMME